MGWKEKRLSRGWKQQLVWLRPECVQRLRRWKERSGKSYQDIINEVIANYDYPVESERDKLERDLLGKVEELVEKRLQGAQAKEPEADLPERERFHIELPEDLDEQEKTRVLNLIRDLHQNEGMSFSAISDYLNRQGIKTVKKKKD